MAASSRRRKQQPSSNWSLTFVFVLSLYGIVLLCLIDQHGTTIPWGILLLQTQSFSDHMEWARQSASCFLQSQEYNYTAVVTVTSAIVIFLILWFVTREEQDTKGAICSKRSVTEEAHTRLFYAVKFAFIIVLSVTLTSVPWEWIRMYQIEVAKRTAILYQDFPAECTPQNMSWMQSLKAWFSWCFTWGHDPCYQYHHALLVNPIWEVTPLMAFSAAFTRFVTTPLELMSSSLGQSMHRILQVIPLTWQPIIFVSILILVTLLLIMTCGYRIAMPYLFSFEPKTTVKAVKSVEQENTRIRMRPSSRRSRRPAVTNSNLLI